jgi:hypothetical protein
METTYAGQLSTAQPPLERIGYGSCGSVWANLFTDESLHQPGNSGAAVIKRGDGLPDRSIENEYQVHQDIQSATIKHTHHHPTWAAIFRVNIPLNLAFLSPPDDAWAKILPRLPAGSAPCHALVSERIMPLPREARQLLVRQFWGEAGDISAVVDDKRNEHCLVRPYLGRRRRRQDEGRRRSMFRSISLRNFPLHIDQLERLGLPAEQYALAMADTLAFLHWKVKTDATDVEFVLGLPRTTTTGTGTATEMPQPSIGTREFTTAGGLGPHAMWVLDFDCCRPLPMDEQGVRIAAERFWRNDPFYPSPDYKCAEDERLWHAFRDRFLDASGEMLKGEAEHVRRLPGMLVARIVETAGLYKKGVVV